MKEKRRIGLGLAALATALLVLSFLAVDFLGIGPNLGVPFGYYGRFNRILSRVEAVPGLEVTQVLLHRDMTLEDFSITVQTPGEGEVQLHFEDASGRPFADLLGELQKIGL